LLPHSSLARSGHIVTIPSFHCATTIIITIIFDIIDSSMLYATAYIEKEIYCFWYLVALYYQQRR
jgi:hypothetical protein